MGLLHRREFIKLAIITPLELINQRAATIKAGNHQFASGVGGDGGRGYLLILRSEPLPVRHVMCGECANDHDREQTDREEISYPSVSSHVCLFFRRTQVGFCQSATVHMQMSCVLLFILFN